MKMFRPFLLSFFLVGCVGFGLTRPLGADETTTASPQESSATESPSVPNTTDSDEAPANPSAPAAPANPLIAPTPEPTPTPLPTLAPAHTSKTASDAPSRVNREREAVPHVSVFGNSYSPANETADSVVTVFGNSEADGPVSDSVVTVFGNSRAADSVGQAVVAVFGNATAEKDVGQDVVAIFGQARANGHVGGKVVSIFGTVELGPQAEVDGEVVCMFGAVHREPGSVVHGQVNSVNKFDTHRFSGAGRLLQDTVFRGRLLYFSPHALGGWSVAFFFLGVYLFLGLAFSRGVTRCAETLEQRPGRTILAAFLALLLTPVLIILFLVLFITIVGPFVLGLALFIGHLFGKAAFMAFIGRRVIKRPGALGTMLAILIGGIVVMLIYTIPFVGLLFWKISSVLGFGMVLYTMILTNRRNREAAVLPPPVIPVGSSTAPSAGPSPVVNPGFVSPPTVPNVSNEPNVFAGSSASASGTAVTSSSAGVPPVSPAPASVPPVQPTMPMGSAATVLPLPPIPRTGPVPPLPPIPPIPPLPPLPPFGQAGQTTGSVLPPTFDFRSLPRVGFWPRVAASALDVVLVALLCAVMHLGEYFIMGYAAYCLVMWALKGTTIGGIICGLRIVRLDGRKIDWTIAVVRVLGAFLSAAVVFLGFIWVAFDSESQSWHDTIAGTTIVRVPKGVSLV